MDLKLSYIGRVTGDQVKIHRSKEMHDMIVSNFAGKEIEITVQRKRRRRGLAQNNYYWGVIVPVVTAALIDAGYKVGKESTHEFLKATSTAGKLSTKPRAKSCQPLEARRI